METFHFGNSVQSNAWHLQSPVSKRKPLYSCHMTSEEEKKAKGTLCCVTLNCISWFRYIYTSGCRTPEFGLPFLAPCIYDIAWPARDSPDAEKSHQDIISTKRKLRSMFSLHSKQHSAKLSCVQRS